MTFPHEIDPGNPNGRIWNQVAKTYPSSTKRVQSFGREFTAIDAYAQIKRATEVFGPVGESWGWDIKSIDHLGQSPHDVVVVSIVLWYVPEPEPSDSPFSGRREFASVGTAQLNMQPRGKDYIRTDADAAKKALTDAITKGLSYMGFNADVFFGAFDSNKYVEAMAEEEKGARQAKKAAPKKPAATDGPDWIDDPLGGEGRFSNSTWREMCKGGVDGGRHKYLRWMFQNYRDDKIVKRVVWVLATHYGDDEPQTGALKKAAVDDGAGYLQEPS